MDTPLHILSFAKGHHNQICREKAIFSHKRKFCLKPAIGLLMQAGTSVTAAPSVLAPGSMLLHRTEECPAALRSGPAVKWQPRNSTMTLHPARYNSACDVEAGRPSYPPRRYGRVLRIR